MTDQPIITNSPSPAPAADDATLLPQMVNPDPTQPPVSLADLATQSDPQTSDSATGADLGVAENGKNPLDVLDEILNEAQAKATQATEEREAEEEQKLAEAHQRQEEKRQQKLQAQRADLSKMKDSPEYHAMIEQNLEEKEAKEEQADKMDGYQIVQLGHKKI